MRHFYQCAAFFLLIILSAFYSPALAQTQWAQKWVSIFTGPGTTTQYPLDMVLDKAGNIYVTGYGDIGHGYDFLTLKYDSDGDLIWESRYDGSENLDDYSSSIDIDDDGNVYVFGFSNYSAYTISGLTIVKYNSNGEEQWARTVTEGESIGRFSVLDNFYNWDVKVGPDGNIYTCGQVYNSGVNLDIVISKINPSGEILWENTYDAAGLADYCPYLGFDTNGNIIMAASSHIIPDWCDIILISYDTSGSKLWTSRFSMGEYSAEYMRSMIISDAGEIYVAGQATNAVSSLIMKYNSSGELEWHDTYGIQMYPTEITLDNSGDVIIVGRTYNFSAKNDYFTLKYSKQGDFMWEKEFNSSGNHEDAGYGVTTDYRGNIYTTGGMGDVGPRDRDYGTLVYSPSGETLHIERYDSPGNGYDIAHKIAFDASGDLVVMGHAHNPLESFNIIQ